MNRIYTFGIILLLLIGCRKNKLDVTYFKDGEKCKETIDLSFISKNGNINSAYIDSIRFGYLDSISFPDGNPDNMKSYISYHPLDFKNEIKPCSPEYYAAYTIYNIEKVIKYYNNLFENKIDFNSQKEYKNIEIVFGNTDFLTDPKVYCFAKNSMLSPSLFFHEIGHRAFWYIENESGLDIRFGGLTVVHMGLLEYFNMSLNNSPAEMEENPDHPQLYMRNARQLYKFPLDSIYTLRYTLLRLKNSNLKDSSDPESDVSKYLSSFYHTYNDYILDNVYDNHLGGMVLASTLWRIREDLGQYKTDKLVAQTIINLNHSMDMRNTYYNGDIDSLSKKIDWHDVFYGLIQEDKKYFKGENNLIITREFSKTGYPIDKIKY